MNVEKLLPKFSIAIRFNLLLICPSEPSFELALLFIPSSNVLSVYFYGFNEHGGSFYCFNFAKYRGLAPLWTVEMFMCLRFNMHGH